jgi:hypothetical protein
MILPHDANLGPDGIFGKDRIERVVGCAIKVRDGVSCRLIEPPSTSHPLRPSRPSNGTDRRAIQGGCMLVHPRRTAHSGDHWTMAGRRLSPYRSRASPKLKLPAFTKFVRSTGCRFRRRHSSILGSKLKRFGPEPFHTNADSRSKTISKNTPC